MYVEAESILHANESYLYMEEVRVFQNINNSKHYFKLEERNGAIQLTLNKTEAALFTLKTTPDLHESGQFQLVHAANSSNETPSELIMKLDLDGRHLSQHGPYKLLPNSKECNDVLHFEIRGRSTSLPK